MTYTFTEFVQQSANRIKSSEKVAYDGFYEIKFALNMAASGNTPQVNFIGLDANDAIVLDLYWYNSGSTITFTPPATMAKWYIWVRYSNNAAITPDAITSAVAEYELPVYWQIQGGDLTNSEFIEMPEYILMPDLPLSVWQCNPLVEGGEALVPLFPDWEEINIQPVKQQPYVSVYDIFTPQAQLAINASNGLAILTPTLCEDTEELGGSWTLSLDHPIDPEERYKLIIEGNIIRAGGQLFTVKKTDEIWEGNSGKVSAECECIWYQWGDGWIYAAYDTPTQIIAKNGNQAITSIMEKTAQDVPTGGMVYAFDGHSDMIYDTEYLGVTEDGCTPIEFILGEKGIIASKGGELHRDNFRFSVNSRKEGAKDNAFRISVGKNLRGIKRTVDTSTMCTYFTLMDRDTGDACSWAWDGLDLILHNMIPHQIIRMQFVSYPANTEKRFEHLLQDGARIFDSMCRPIICYEIDLEDVRQNPDFEITADESLRCGDSGIVFDSRLGGEIPLEITKTTYDRITGKCKKIVVGDKQSFVQHSSAPVVFPIQPEVVGGTVWVSDSTGRKLYDKNGVKIVTEVI